MPVPSITGHPLSLPEWRISNRTQISVALNMSLSFEPSRVGDWLRYGPRSTREVNVASDSLSLPRIDSENGGVQNSMKISLDAVLSSANTRVEKVGSGHKCRLELKASFPARALRNELDSVPRRI